MNNRIILSVAASVLILGSNFAASIASAQDVDVPGHPRVSEVDQRLQNQQNRIDSGVQNGTLTAKQATNDEKRDAKVSQELSADQAKNGGHITKAEQKKMNKQLNHNSKKIHKQKAAATPAQ